MYLFTPCFLLFTDVYAGVKLKGVSYGFDVSIHTLLFSIHRRLRWCEVEGCQLRLWCISSHLAFFYSQTSTLVWSWRVPATALMYLFSPCFLLFTDVYAGVKLKGVSYGFGVSLHTLLSSIHRRLRWCEVEGCQLRLWCFSSHLAFFYSQTCTLVWSWRVSATALVYLFTPCFILFKDIDAGVKLKGLSYGFDVSIHTLLSSIHRRLRWCEVEGCQLRLWCIYSHLSFFYSQTFTLVWSWRVSATALMYLFTPCFLLFTDVYAGVKLKGVSYGFDVSIHTLLSSIHRRLRWCEIEGCQLRLSAHPTLLSGGRPAAAALRATLSRRPNTTVSYIYIYIICIDR